MAMARERDREGRDSKGGDATGEARDRGERELERLEESGWRGPGEGPGYAETRGRTVPFLQGSTGGQIPGEYRQWEEQERPAEDIAAEVAGVVDVINRRQRH